jgi:hypothetical protein
MAYPRNRPRIGEAAMKRRQLGYLYEIPLLVMVTGIIAAVLWPRLLPPWHWLALVPFAAACGYFVYYVIVRRR